ncbi:MAG TPA: PIG-L family deacetylase [Candidatus Angelobacter sp.]|nr:PIG-L family deacetylase [Candidatus Angelobacter sp.]
MKTILSMFRTRSSYTGFIFLLCILLLSQGTVLSDTRPLPEDQGAIHLYQLLTKLKTTARLMQVVAHPDDEDGGMMTLESRGKGVSILLLTVTRGEGGQNKFGAESSDELGILRTLELLEADKYYDVEQRFTHVADFGFSKTAEETFNKWHGHDVALADLVRAIRTFRPDVLTSRFSGTKRDGHGNHEASGVLTAEAFRAAGDPNRFPEQIKEGLLPWQARKLYLGNPPRMFSGGTVSDEDFNVKLDVGEYSPILGMAYGQFSLEGLAHQTSQGTGGIRVPPGHRYTYYKLMDTTLAARPPAAHESDFFDGIDTSIAGLESAGDQKSDPAFIHPALAAIARDVDEANKLFSLDDPSACAPPLLAGLKETRELIQRIETSSLSAESKAHYLTPLRTKLDQFQQAANEALGIFFEATVDQTGPPPAPSYFPRMEQTMSLAVPGQTFTVTARLYNRGKKTIVNDGIRVEVPEGWKVEPVPLSKTLNLIKPGESDYDQFKITVPENAKYTEPYFTRRDPEAETVYKISDPALLTLPWAAYPVHATAVYSALLPPSGNLVSAQVTQVTKSGELPMGSSKISSVAKVKFVDPALGQSERPLAVGPPISILLANPVVVVSATGKASAHVEVSVRSNVQSAVHARLRLETPQGWKVEPQSVAVDLDHDGDINNYSFHLAPQGLHEGSYQVSARADYNGKTYGEGFKVITRPDLDSYYAYRPATQEVEAVDVKLPAKLSVGYVMGAGDEIASVLHGLGLNVDLTSPQDLASGDLSRYDTIVVGIRAYDVRTDIRELNRRLLDYVKRGGTLIVQYNQSVGVFNDGHFTPYPATLSNARVSVEEQPVDVLLPDSPVFSYPNRITAKDFDGWVQERGLYFMGQWDEQFKPLLSSHDPGESAQKGGLLLAHYGQGTYIYCGYAFFRQLPAGVPGAIRLFVNLLAAGHESPEIRRAGGD